jgi:hypothetical protein
MGSLLDQAREDIKQITSNLNDFAIPATFTAPTAETKDINVIHSKHHTSIDTDGRRVNSKNASLSFSESLMVGYPVRDNKGEVNLKGHLVQVPDSTGVVKTYSINQWYPDETLGLIVCIIGDYE